MNDIQIFNNPEFGEIRTVEINREPWLVGKDVATVLGYINPSKALADHVDEEDKLNNESLLSLGQRGGWLINESGLYSLVLSSKLPSAKKFKRWVTSEVLPAIRKTGNYSARPHTDPAIAAKRVQVMELNARSRVAAQMLKLWSDAGVAPQYQAIAMQSYYPNLSLPREALADQAQALLDATTIAKNLGILSKSGARMRRQLPQSSRSWEHFRLKNML